MQKSDRHESILHIIDHERVSRQDQLVDLLNDEGYGVTQASVSRDLVELGIVKVNGIYADPSNKPVEGLGNVEMTTAGDNLIVAKCQSGLASAIAVKIDAAHLKEIVGTIAGDDTIFLAVKDTAAQRLAMKKLWDVLSR